MGQLLLNAFEQPAANAIQRVTHARLRTLQSVGDLSAAEVLGVMKVEQLFVGGPEPCFAAPQSIQVRFRLAAVNLANGLRELIQ